MARSAAVRSSRPTRRASAPRRRLEPLPGEAPDGGAAQLDRIIHERLRLGMVSALALFNALLLSYSRGAWVGLVLA